MTTSLAHYLEKRGIKDIYLMGLALDYCVKIDVGA
jgi:nicotinamidase-related amidase